MQTADGEQIPLPRPRLHHPPHYRPWAHLFRKEAPGQKREGKEEPRAPGLGPSGCSEREAGSQGWVRQRGEGEGTPGAGSHGVPPVEGSGLAWARAPVLRGLGLSALSAAAEVKASLHCLPGACPPLRICLSPCPPPLSPSRPGLAFLNVSISLSARRSPVEVSGSLSVSGMSVALIVSEASLSPPDLRAQLAVSPALAPSPSFVSVSAYPSIPPTPRPTPASLSLRLSLSRLLSVSLLVLAPLKFLSETLPPSLSGAFPALAPSAQAWQIPFPCQVTMKTLATRKPPVFPVGIGVLPPQFPKTSLGESWDTPIAVVERVQLRLQCAKQGVGERRNKKANFGAGGVPL